MTTTENVKEMRDNLDEELQSVIRETGTLLDDTYDNAEKNTIRRAQS